MNSKGRGGWFLLMGLLLGLGLGVGQAVLADRASSQKVPLDDIRNFVEILERVKQEYVEPVDESTLMQNAIRGMLSGLDPHSSYLDASEFKEMQINTSGRFGGLGIEVQMEDGFVKVVTPIDDTPAARAGLQPGDLIIKLDDTQVKGLSLTDAVNRMRGEPGSQIRLTILREKQDAPFVVTLTRDIINVQSVKRRLLEPGYGYVRITQFRNDAGKDLEDALSKLVAENKAPLRGLVLDLRNNPGGLLTAAVEVTDVFQDSGLVVYTQGREKASRQDFPSKPGDSLRGAPMVVLVNGGSASASEIVAGALQDNKRALVVGTRTFGKGSVQTVLPLPSGDAIKLTTARYYTPGGRSIQAEGIDPDIALQAVKVSKVDAPIGLLRESDLSGRLAPEGKATPVITPTAPEEKDGDLVATDYQLYESLNLLKGMTLVQSRR
ncbi:MAG: S41 family peptidase [Candidatus Macondimonas sp.]|jgi:carboxyl-terminal processing protease